MSKKYKILVSVLAIIFSVFLIIVSIFGRAKAVLISEFKKEDTVILLYDLLFEKSDEAFLKYDIYSRKYHFIAFTLGEMEKAKQEMLPELNRLYTEYEKSELED